MTGVADNDSNATINYRPANSTTATATTTTTSSGGRNRSRGAPRPPEMEFAPAVKKLQSCLCLDILSAAAAAAAARDGETNGAVELCWKAGPRWAATLLISPRSAVLMASRRDKGNTEAALWAPDRAGQGSNMAYMANKLPLGAAGRFLIH